MDIRAFVTELAGTLAEMISDTELLQLLSTEAAAPLQSNDEVRLGVRDLIRHGGFNPTGRNKPASEYLIKAAKEGALSTINLAVDIRNAVSFTSVSPLAW